MDGHFDCRKSKQTGVIWEIRYIERILHVHLKEWNVWKSMKIGFISFMINNFQKPKYVNVWKTEMEDGVDEGRKCLLSIRKIIKCSTWAPNEFFVENLILNNFYLKFFFIQSVFFNLKAVKNIYHMELLLVKI